LTVTSLSRPSAMVWFRNRAKSIDAMIVDDPVDLGVWESRELVAFPIRDAREV
jgi:hypothetical protein